MPFVVQYTLFFVLTSGGCTEVINMYMCRLCYVCVCAFSQSKKNSRVPVGDRTPNPRLRRPMLYPLSYRDVCCFRKRAQRDVNCPGGMNRFEALLRCCCVASKRCAGVGSLGTGFPWGRAAAGSAGTQLHAQCAVCPLHSSMFSPCSMPRPPNQSSFDPNPIELHCIAWDCISSVSTACCPNRMQPNPTHCSTMAGSKQKDTMR